MGKERKYEFRYLSRTARLKIIGARVFVFVLMTAIGFDMLIAPDELPRQLSQIGALFTCVFVYVNLMDVEVDISEMFQWEFGHRGVEFTVLGFLFLLYGTYLQYFA